MITRDYYTDHIHHDGAKRKVNANMRCAYASCVMHSSEDENDEDVNKSI